MVHAGFIFSLLELQDDVEKRGVREEGLWSGSVAKGAVSVQCVLGALLAPTGGVDVYITSSPSTGLLPASMRHADMLSSGSPP